jgi:hypothetical protein
MKQHRLPITSVTTGRFSPESRGGVTLTEVLMSLLVMSVAVSSVMILFPISLLRSVKGRQITQATILRYNAENELDLHPNMFSHMNVIQDVAGNNMASFENIQSGQNLFIDPLGWHRMWEIDEANNFQTNYRKWIGDRANGLRRFNSGLRNVDLDTITANQQFLDQAQKRVSLPDTWINTTRGFPGYDPINDDPLILTLTDDFDLSGVPTNRFATDPPTTNSTLIPDPKGIARVTVFDATARFSDVRTIVEIITDGSGDQSLKLSAPLSPRVLDANNIPGEARIEIQEQRYTWMLTVRSSVRSADVVVFFRRSFSPEDERIYRDPDQFDPDNDPVNRKTFFNTVEVEEDGTVRPHPVTDLPIPNRRILIKWEPDEAEDNFLPKPSMRRNAYVLDVQNALWYRIHNIENEKSNEATLVLDEVIKTFGAEGAILMQGIVDVYSISF